MTGTCCSVNTCKLQKKNEFKQYICDFLYIPGCMKDKMPQVFHGRYADEQCKPVRTDERHISSALYYQRSSHRQRASQKATRQRNRHRRQGQTEIEGESRTGEEQQMRWLRSWRVRVTQGEVQEKGVTALTKRSWEEYRGGTLSSRQMVAEGMTANEVSPKWGERNGTNTGLHIYRAAKKKKKNRMMIRSLLQTELPSKHCFAFIWWKQKSVAWRGFCLVCGSFCFSIVLGCACLYVPFQSSHISHKSFMYKKVACYTKFTCDNGF